MSASLDTSLAAHIAGLALAGVERPYPVKPGVVLESSADLVEPRVRTPAFYGCFDWHSAVHAHWTLCELVRRFDASEWRGEALRVLRAHLSSAAIDAELAHRRAAPSYEIPYGTAWLLMLQASIERCAELAPQAEVLRPLSERAMEQSLQWFRALPCPIRGGEHSQSAFGLGLFLDASRSLQRDEWVSELTDLALCHHGNEGPAALHHEPSAYDFLSPSLSIADLMSQVLDTEDFEAWLQRVLPQPGFEAVRSANREDGKLCHWEGLNLSRAWMLRRVGESLRDDHPAKCEFLERAASHLETGLSSLDSSHYAGTHWLGTFALRALLIDQEPDCAGSGDGLP